jgi:HK97 gp10 family phage protein
MAISKNAAGRRNRGYAKVSKLRRKLRRLPEEATKGIKTAMTELAADIERSAKSRVPVDTGTLKANISAKVSRDGLSARIGVQGKRASRKAFYGPFVEFGTVKTPAQPFMGPAFEENKTEGVKRIGAEIDRAFLTVSAGGDGGE